MKRVRASMAGAWAAATLALAGPACAIEPPGPTLRTQSTAAQEIQKTERAFAKTVAQLGISPGFLHFAGPGAIMFVPDPEPAAPHLQATHAQGTLQWRPQYIGVAPSGDLAFSLGPSLYRAAGRSSGGFYLTIWRHAVDGVWTFALDHGVDMPASIFDGPAEPFELISTAPDAKADPSEGLRESDAGLNGDISNSAPRAFARRLDEQALVVRANRPVASGRRRAIRLLNEAPALVEAQLLDAGVSADGVLGYTYGKARWTTPAGMQQGYYVRVWRNVGQGWRLLVDHTAER